MTTWRDHVRADEVGGLLCEYDDGSAVFLSAHDGGAAPQGAWGGLSLMWIAADGETHFRRLVAAGDWGLLGASLSSYPKDARGVSLLSTQIVVERQALLDVVRALDIGVTGGRLPAALDALREPLFSDEMSSGKARTDFSVNKY